MDGKENATTKISFDDFVRAYCRGQRPGYANVGSQAKFLETQPNGCLINHLFRYENQDRLIEFLQQKLDTTIQLKQENVSPVMELPLSPQVETILRRKCTEDFDLYDSIR